VKSEVLVTKRKVLACMKVDDLLIVATGDQKIDDAAWEEFCQNCETLIRRWGPCTSVLSWAPLHGPDAKQRDVLAKKYGDAVHLKKQKRTALLSGSAIVRGIVTAMSWWRGGEMGTRSFVPDQDHAIEALNWLSEVSDFRRLAALSGLAEVKQALSLELEKAG